MNLLNPRAKKVNVWHPSGFYEVIVFIPNSLIYLGNPVACGCLFKINSRNLVFSSHTEVN